MDIGVISVRYARALLKAATDAKLEDTVYQEMSVLAQSYIDESLQKAHEASERLANIQKEGESMLQEARQKQAQILKEAADTRDAIVAQAQEKAREEGNRLIAEAKSEIESQKQAAISEIRAQVAELSVKVAEKILRKELSSDAKQMETIDRLLDEVAVEDKR